LKQAQRFTANTGTTAAGGGQELLGGSNSDELREITVRSFFQEVGRLEEELDDSGMFDPLIRDFERLFGRARDHHSKQYTNNEMLIRQVWAVTVHTVAATLHA
jgi:hypothetical protein